MSFDTRKGRLALAAPISPLLLAVVALLTPLALPAETLTFEADGAVKIVRAYDQYGMAVIEFIGSAGAIYQCVVMDAAGAPIATASAVADMGQIMVQGIAADKIASVACRKVL